MKKTVFAVLVVMLVSLISSCNSEKEIEPIIYEHEKLYEQFKQENPNDWEPVPQTTMGETVIVGNSGSEVSFFKNEETLFSKDGYSVTVSYPVERAESPNKVQTAPDIYINKGGYAKALFIKDGFYAYDSEGNEVVRLITGSHTPGYYDPFEKDHEPHCWYKVTENGIQFKFLAMEAYFISNNYLPWAMNEEDYQKITKNISKRESFNDSTLWNFNVGDWIATEKNLELLGLQLAVDREVFEEGIHVVKQGEEALYKELNDIFEKMGYTIEDKRLIESKVVKENYAANMAMITITLDFSEDVPTMDLSFETISPAESEISNIYLGGKDIDYNQLIADAFSE